MKLTNFDQAPVKAVHARFRGNRNGKDLIQQPPGRLQLCGLAVRLQSHADLPPTLQGASFLEFLFSYHYVQFIDKICFMSV
jgi:hypothetical protein